MYINYVNYFMCIACIDSIKIGDEISLAIENVMCGQESVTAPFSNSKS